MNELKYEPLNDSHANDLLPIWGDEDVIRYTNIIVPCTVDEIKDRIRILKEFDVFIVRNEEDNVVGIIGCPAIDKEKQEYGIFYQFRKSSWGQGYAKKAAGWLLNYMKGQYKEFTIMGDVNVDNTASQKILIHYGFEVIGEEKGERNNVPIKLRKFKLKWNA